MLWSADDATFPEFPITKQAHITHQYRHHHTQNREDIIWISTSRFKNPTHTRKSDVCVIMIKNERHLVRVERHCCLNKISMIKNERANYSELRRCFLKWWSQTALYTFIVLWLWYNITRCMLHTHLLWKNYRCGGNGWESVPRERCRFRVSSYINIISY